MCGVAFLWAPATPAAERALRMDSALQCLRHRGPDDSGVLLGPEWAVGHTRLAIVAPTGGRQPVRDPSARWTLTFNGEIYNYRELRDRLRSRWDFRDDSDTEVLLAGLATEGEHFIQRLEGMWAFVLHDAATGRLLLSRDRFGKKPLYYRSDGDAFACASEIPALRALLPDVEWGEDPAGLGDYFRYGFTLPGKTCLSGVFELLPAHWAVRHANGALDGGRYWSPAAEPWQGTFEKAADEIRQRLSAAVSSRQLAADVEVGAFLSGGIDSTIVCALAQRSGFGRLRTFTAGFSESSFDERVHAARAAAELGTLHTAEEIPQSSAQALTGSLPKMMGQPLGDASLVPTALVAKVAARDVKVVLTGDGGDEVFGGYARYAGRLLRQVYHRFPEWIRTATERAVMAFPEPISHHSGSLLKRAHLFVALAREAPNSYVAPHAVRPNILARLVPELPEGNTVPEAPWPSDPDEIRHMMLMDWLIWLPQDILTKVDRATMAASLEGRSPFLDRDLVEFVLRLPWSWHFSGFRGKRLLRAAMRGSVPDFIWSRRKQGFASPVGHWMRGGVGDELAALAGDGDAGLIDSAALRTLLAEHRERGVDHSQPLWLAYTYLHWRNALHE